VQEPATLGSLFLMTAWQRHLLTLVGKVRHVSLPGNCVVLGGLPTSLPSSFLGLNNTSSLTRKRTGQPSCFTDFVSQALASQFFIS
jgi:hypothetical protein